MRGLIRMPGLLAHLVAVMRSGEPLNLPPLPLTRSERGPRDKRDYLSCPSKYMPHQGKRECARRARRLAVG